MCELADFVFKIFVKIVLEAEPDIFKSHPSTVAAPFKDFAHFSKLFILIIRSPVNLEQSLNVYDISVTLLGIIGAFSKLLHPENVPKHFCYRVWYCVGNRY